MGLLASSRLPPTYESETTLLVGGLTGDSDVIRAAGEQTRTYAAIATTAIIIGPAARRIGLSPESLKSKVDVTGSDVTRLLSIRAHDGNSVRAPAIANAVADELVSFSSQGGIQVPREARVEIIERASSPAHSTGPSARLIVPLTAFAGLLAALGLAALADSLSRTVRDEHELAALVPVAVLGSVDGGRAGRSGRLVVETKRDSATAEAYRLLAAKVELSNGDRPLRSIVVVDAQPGRSSIGLAANLAEVLAERGSRVALLDSANDDNLLAFYGYSEDSASSETRVRRGRPLRIGRSTLERFRVRRSGVTILRPRDPSERLELDEATDVLERVLVDADVVVLTVPPLESSANSLVWSRAAEATLLVTERGHSKREQISAAVESLNLAGANVIGVVLCKVRVF